jgi:PEGA domain-containing protein
MTTQVDPRLPRIVDDVWEPPPRTGPNWLPIVIAAAVLVIAGVSFVTVRAGVFERDPGSAEESRSLWYPDSTERVGWRSQLAARSPDAAPEADVRSVRPAPPPARRPARPPVRPSVRATPPPPPAPPPPSLPGYLAVNSTPWAELSVDGRVVGNTPQLRVNVAAGRHQLVFTRDGFAAESTWVTVAPGTTVKVTGIALTRVAP